MRNHRQSFVDWYRKKKELGMFKGSHYVYTEMQKHFDSIYIINIHAAGVLMTQVYCDILSDATNSCAWHKKHVQASNAREANHTNPSVLLWPLAVADEAIHQGLTLRNQRNIAERITTYAQEINYTLPYECLKFSKPHCNTKELSFQSSLSRR